MNGVAVSGFRGGILANSNSRLTIENSSITGNTTTAQGAGLYIASGATVTMLNSTIANNKGASALYIAGTANLLNVTVAGNDATGIQLESTGTLNAVNSK